ncbi:MAG: WecB/TagA/CpsF family glycosyltransferase, partial [bacterium]|nr:WecB/TagA/CpsF family glycosyltransferase [bacterium]
MNILKNEPGLKMLRFVLAVLMLVIISSSLVIPYPLTLFKIIVIALLLLGVLTFYFEGVYRLEDFLYLFLVTGTFVFGKAFSLIGFRVPGLPLFVTELALAGSLAFIVFQAKKALENWKQAMPTGLLIAFLAYVGMGTVYLLLGFKANGSLALRDVAFCHYALFFFITVNVLKTPDRVKKLAALFVPAAAAVMLMGYLWNFGDPDGKIAIYPFTRPIKAFNWGLIFGLIVLFVLAFFAYGEIKKRKFLKGFLIWSGLLFVILTHVRAGWVGLIAALVFLAIVLKKETRVLLLIIPLVVGALFVIDHYREDELAKITEEVTSMVPGAEKTFPRMNIIWRMKIWDQRWQKIKKQPVRGGGIGSFPAYILWGRKAPKIVGIGPGSNIIPPHNHLFAITYKMGFVGLGLFICMNLWVFLRGVRYINRCRSPFNRRFLVASLAGLIYWHGMAFFFDVLESPPTGIFLWVLLGLIISVVYVDEKMEPRNTRKDTDLKEGFEKRGLFGIDYAVVDYERASDVIVEHAAAHESFGVSALAVHGLVTSVKDKDVGDRVKKIDMVVPDGQPVRWALNSFHQVGMKDRVYGPTLTLRVLEKASEKKLNVYLYGSTVETLEKFSGYIEKTYPGVNLCGIHVDRFRNASPAEDAADIEKINAAGAHIVLVGRGCPRQEIWVADHLGKVNAAMMAVGAAFDFHAGTLKQAPPWMQKHGLEWFYRLLKEPRRLRKRYFGTNSYFIYLYCKHKLLKKRSKKKKR